MENKRYRTPGEYPVGEDNFPKIRQNGLLYVDKTAYIYQLTRLGYVLPKDRTLKDWKFVEVE